MSPAPTASGGAKRRPDRRARILAAAMDLFHRKGYHATGMDEIGAAAGITGPGIYRHFESKEQILATGDPRGGDRVAGAQPGHPGRARGRREAALDGLIANFVEGLIADRWLSAVIMRERHALSPDTRRWVDQAERDHIEAWVQALRRLRPDLDRAGGPPHGARRPVDVPLRGLLRQRGRAATRGGDAHRHGARRPARRRAGPLSAG